jgi:hypothetical protein
MSYNETIAAIPMPARIAALPISDAGYPVPWFVQWLDERGKPCVHGEGQPDFRVVDAIKFRQSLHGQPRCWICGETLGRHKVFTIGPMCAINRVISEPPAHRDCAEYSVKACPFLSKPRMRRNEKDLPPNRLPVAGNHIDRNPGAMCLWETKTYKPFKAGGGILFALGDPVRVDWWAEGRAATRDEIIAAIDSGYPQLDKMAKDEGADAMAELEARRRFVMQRLVPA